MKYLIRINLALILLLISFNSWAQDKKDTIRINVKNNLATITPALYDTNTIELETFKNVYLEVFNSDSIQFNVEIRDIIADSVISTISFNKSVTSSGKQLAGVVRHNNCSILSIGFENSDIKFSFKNSSDKPPYITIINKSASTKTSINCDSPFNFIPEIYHSNKGKWPNYVCSTNENVKYRFSIDFSKSFSQASLWKLKTKKDTVYYKLKNTIRPRYLRFMTMSVKNYYPQYDSIVTSTAFNSYNLEGRSVFEKYEKKVIRSSDGDSPNNSTDNNTNPKSTTSKDKNDKIEKLLKKLDSDLKIYNNYLSRNIIDKSIWYNDIQYINSKLNQCLDLTDYTVNGLLLNLKKHTKDSELKNKTELIHSIIISYAAIQNYSILSTSPIQIKDKDVLTFNLDFFKEGKKVESRNYSFLIEGGFKIDYSSGFAYSSLRDESYQIIDKGTRTDTTFFVDEYFNTTDSITGLTETNLKGISLLNEDVNIGVSALMHFYSRTGTLINLGGTFGFMLNTKAEFNYLLGGSLIFGQNQRFILSGGASFGQINRLNPKYSTSEIYTESQLGQVSDSQLTIKKWDIGYFIGISYNLGGIK
jgi:hypothetical protein